MFERIAQTEAEKDAEAAEGRSPDQIDALRLAALIIFANVVVTLAVVMVFRIREIPIIQMVIALFLSYYLYKLRPRAEALALGLTILGAIVQPLLLFLKQPLLVVVITALPVWGMTAALLLLLIGNPTRARRIAAVSLFGVLTVGFYALSIFGRIAE